MRLFPTLSDSQAAELQRLTKKANDLHLDVVSSMPKDSILDRKLYKRVEQAKRASNQVRAFRVELGM